MNQRTIAEKISCTGIGLHTGQPVQLTLHPARSNTGVIFARTDLGHPVEIPAHPRSVASTTYATTLGCGDATIGTVEHLLAALYSLGIDNVRLVTRVIPEPATMGLAVLALAAVAHRLRRRRRA